MKSKQKLRLEIYIYAISENGVSPLRTLWRSSTWRRPINLKPIEAGKGCCKQRTRQRAGKTWWREKETEKMQERRERERKKKCSLRRAGGLRRANGRACFGPTGRCCLCHHRRSRSCLSSQMTRYGTGQSCCALNVCFFSTVFVYACFVSPRSEVLLDFYQVFAETTVDRILPLSTWSDETEWYSVLPSFHGSDWIRLMSWSDFNKFYFVSPSFSGPYRVPQKLNKLIVSHSFTGQIDSVGFSLDFIGFNCTLLDFTGFYWVLLVFTGFYWLLLVFTRL